MLDLNCRTAVHLVHAFGARMVARGRGGVVLLSSMASQQGSALVAHYAATKDYLRVLAEGRYAEQRLLPRRSVVRLASARTREMYPTGSHRPAPAGGRDG